jgi:hypothetical protein
MRLLLVDLDSSYNLPVKKLSAFLYHNLTEEKDKDYFLKTECGKCCIAFGSVHENVDVKFGHKRRLGTVIM